MAARETRRRSLVPTLLLAGYALLLAAWVVGNPPFAAPDEAGHYLRAVGIGGGELIGEKSGYEDPELTPRQAEFSEQTARRVSVPAGLAPDSFGCNADRPAESAACQYGAPVPETEVSRASHVGAYLPLPYLLPAAVVRAGDDPPSADRWGRFASALLVFALLAAATVALWGGDRGGVSLAGLVAAVTPMVLFMGAVINGSGLEIASGIAFAATLLRITREERRSGRWWLLAAISGAALALSRPLGPVWVVLLVGLAIALDGRESARRRFRAAGGASWWTAGTVAGACVLNRVWEAMYGAETELGLNPFPDSIESVYRGSRRIVPEVIGTFGVLDIRAPAIALVGGYLLIGTVLLAAAALATRRQRIVLIAAAGAAIVLPGLAQWVSYRHTGFWIQGRYFLPVLTAVPLVAGEVLFRHADRLPERWRSRLLLAFGAVAAVVHLGAWFWNARRHAVGTDGPRWFLDAAEWSPPEGWTVWLLVAAAGALALAAAGLAASRSPESKPVGPAHRATGVEG